MKPTEFHSKNKFEKLVHLVSFIIRMLSLCSILWYFIWFIIRICHDARSHVSQNSEIVCNLSKVSFISSTVYTAVISKALNDRSNITWWNWWVLSATVTAAYPLPSGMCFVQLGPPLVRNRTQCHLLCSCVTRYITPSMCPTFDVSHTYSITTVSPQEHKVKLTICVTNELLEKYKVTKIRSTHRGL